jgi:hypothetical protein
MLSGTGHTLSGDRAIAAPKKPGNVGNRRLRTRGHPQDLVYTPITPCRIVDTRNIACPAAS